MLLLHYLFSPPVNGPRLSLLTAVFVGMLVLGLLAWLAVHRFGLAAQRRRVRGLRSIMLGAALPGLGYVACRYVGLTFLNWRVWYILILAIWLTRLAFWVLSLRNLSHDIVDEKQARRQQTYFKRTGAKRRKRKRR